MGFLKRSPKATAAIHFVDHNNEARKSSHWTSEDTVRGVAAFRLPPGTDCTHASVSLKGIATIKINESPPASLQPTWRTEKVKFLSVGKDLRLAQSGDGGLQAPFQFDLHECLRHSMLESALPPSLNSRIENSDRKSFNKQDGRLAYDISYAITASAFSGRAAIASASSALSLLPVGQSDPPSYGSAEVAGEYHTARSEPPPKSTGFQADVAAQEPSPLILQARPGESDPATSVDFMLKISSEDARALSNLPQQVQIRTQLVQKTQVSPNGAALQAAGQKWIQDPDLQLRVSKRNVQDCTLAVSKWETYQPDQGTPGFAIARLSFLYRHPVADRLTAGFSTPILSRSYALEVKVSFAGSALQDLKVSLPVSVVYESLSLDLRSGGLLERKKTARSCVDQ